MKILSLKSIVAGLLSFTTTLAFAQPTAAAAKMYATLPNQINIETNTLVNTLNFSKGSEVTIPLSSELIFTGTVIFKDVEASKLQTIAIKSSTNNNAVLHINKITDLNNNISFTGRILNPKAADGYLIKSINGTYFLQKFENNLLLDPCN